MLNRQRYPGSPRDNSNIVQITQKKGGGTLPQLFYELRIVLLPADNRTTKKKFTNMDAEFLNIVLEN